MADLPQPGVYGDTGVDTQPVTPFGDHNPVERPPVGLDPASEPNPQTVIGEAIRKLLGR